MTVVNGYKINTGRGQAGYAGTCFSTEWRGHDAAPFIATATRPNDNSLDKYIAPGARVLHLGYYDDSRKAAYVAAMYQHDPKATVQLWIAHNKQIEVEYPKELFELPEYLTLEDAQRMLAGHGVKVSPKQTRACATRVVAAHVHADKPATDVATQIWGNNVFIDLAKKFGKETVLTARKYLNVNEFALRFGLKLI